MNKETKKLMILLEFNKATNEHSDNLLLPKELYYLNRIARPTYFTFHLNDCC